MRTPRRTLLPVSLLVLALLCGLWAAPAQAGTKTKRMREKLLHFVNDERRDRGVAALREVDGLSDLARAHTLQMVRQRRLFHSSDLGSKLSAWSPTRWGENVGVGPSIWAIVRMWVKSPGHLYNMVYAGYHRAGVSVVRSGGMYWATLIVIS